MLLYLLDFAIHNLVPRIRLDSVLTDLASQKPPAIGIGIERKSKCAATTDADFSICATNSG
jgi:hypothetical protein